MTMGSGAVQGRVTTLTLPADVRVAALRPLQSALPLVEADAQLLRQGGVSAPSRPGGAMY